MPTPSRLVGIVLAAGQSSRMGRPKALLRCPPDGDTFVVRIARTLHAAGVQNLAVVGRIADTALRAELRQLEPAVEFLPNPTPELGQLSSLLVGIDYAERAGADGALALPVDIPLVLVSTVEACIAAFNAGAAAIVRATHQGRHGHPVIFGAAVFAELRGADPAMGAKAVLRRYPSRVLDVETLDRGVIRDVDDPEDYRRLFHREPF